jgi:hypothetical protein
MAVWCREYRQYDPSSRWSWGRRNALRHHTLGDSYGSGSGGRVQLISEQGNIVLTANTVIRNDNFSSGLGGDVVINAAQGLTLIDSEIRTNGQSSGFAGNITLQAPNVTLNNSIISAETQNNAPAGGSFVTPLGQFGFLVAGANINISGTGAGHSKHAGQ